MRIQSPWRCCGLLHRSCHPQSHRQMPLQIGIAACQASVLHVPQATHDIFVQRKLAPHQVHCWDCRPPFRAWQSGVGVTTTEVVLALASCCDLLEWGLGPQEATGPTFGLRSAAGVGQAPRLYPRMPSHLSRPQCTQRRHLVLANIEGSPLAPMGLQCGGTHSPMPRHS